MTLTLLVGSGSPINQGHLFHQENINIAHHGLVGATAWWYVRTGKSGTAGPQPVHSLLLKPTAAAHGNTPFLPGLPINILHPQSIIFFSINIRY